MNHQNSAANAIPNERTTTTTNITTTNPRAAYVLGQSICKTVSWLQGVAVSASINTMVTVTMDR